VANNLNNDRIVWIDCEMTGLDLQADALVEVAAVVTDSELNVLGEGVDVVIRPEPAALEQMNDFVRDMHTTSGLLDELDAGMTLEDAQQAVLDYVRAWARPRAAPRSPETRSGPTKRSSTVTCPSSPVTCTTGSSTSPRSRS